MTAAVDHAAPENPGPSSSAPGQKLSEHARVPRVLTFAVVKRIDPRLPNTWGHWWIELDGQESYGWWPSPCPMGWRGALLGSRGCLNGIGGDSGGSPTRDAYHGDEPDHWFHPTLLAPKCDDEVRREIRAFAQSYLGGFRWQWWWLREAAENCRTFQDEMFEAVGLYEDPGYLYTRGSGCPFMYPFRRVRWRIVDGLAAVVARARSWSSTHIERSGDWTIRAQRHPGASPPLLTEPRARAQARSRGTLVPGQRGSADA